MSIYTFERVSSSGHELGGKAWGLATLFQAGFPVPPGVILTQPPTPAEQEELLTWWKSRGRPALAVRSSAAAEDSAETSFAGQNQSFLNVSSPNALEESIRGCFESSQRSASQAYREHFIGDGKTAAMNVVVQEMVNPRFAGVFFSHDPRAGGGWILEVIRGLGEDLVSGHVTPGQVRADGACRDLPPGFDFSLAKSIAEIGQRVAQQLKFSVDMEWAVDALGQIQVLQARPITTLKKNFDPAMVQKELARLKETHPATTTWDGQTFTEWNGLPTPFTFSLWQEAFSPHHAFGEALKALGYASFREDVSYNQETLLENILGRAYINLERMTDLYYGPIPYSIEARPRPHTRFDRRKITPAMIAHMPAAVWSMLRVAWNVSARRRKWLAQSAEALNRQTTRMARPRNPQMYAALKFSELQRTLAQEREEFTREILHWPLLLVVLTESTIQNLRLVLKSVVGEDQVDRKLREWMAIGLHTVTLEMTEEMQKAGSHPVARASFMAKFGHRGPGEMDLSHPRWIEIGEKAFIARPSWKTSSSSSSDVETEIKNFKSYKRDVVLDEWRLFKRMLEHREQWKMEILEPYAEIRFLLEELGRRTGLGSDIHWLNPSEVAALPGELSELQRGPLAERIATRKKTAEIYRKISLPEILSLGELESAVRGEPAVGDSTLVGESLSPGIAYGEVRFVEDPNAVDVSQWPANTILVAEATDPGWTPLFLQAKGIVVERGGVLSHCAIVARELSIPAVSGIHSLRASLKEGDRIWVDGHTGRIRREGAKS